MKRKIAVLTLVAFLIVGCSGTSFLCKNKQTILDGLQFVINQGRAVIAAVQASYPGVVPAVAQAIIDQAQKAIDVATAAAAQVCPTETQLTAAQGQLTQATMNMSIALRTGQMKLGR